MPGFYFQITGFPLKTTRHQEVTLPRCLLFCSSVGLFAYPSLLSDTDQRTKDTIPIPAILIVMGRQIWHWFKNKIKHHSNFSCLCQILKAKAIWQYTFLPVISSEIGCKWDKDLFLPHARRCRPSARRSRKGSGLLILHNITRNKHGRYSRCLSGHFNKSPYSTLHRESHLTPHS